MADSPISLFAALTIADSADILAIVDVSLIATDPSHANKKITIANLMGSPGPIGAITPSTGSFTTLKLSTGATIDEFSTDGSLGGNSDTAVPTEKAVKTYIDSLNFGSYVHTQSVPSTIWTVVHNLGNQYVNVQVIDDTDSAYVPAEIVFDSTTSLTIYFNSPMTGHASISSGGAGTSGTSGNGTSGTSGSSGISGTSGSSGTSGTTAIAGGFIHTQSVASDTWTVEHNLGYQYVNVEVADDNDQAVIPTTITFDSSTTLTITFSSPITGHAAVTSGGGQTGSSGVSGTSGTSGTSGVGGTNWSGVWQDGSSYVSSDLVVLNGSVYVSKINHISSATNKPGSGIDWQTYWNLFIPLTYAVDEGVVYLNDGDSTSEVIFTTEKENVNYKVSISISNNGDTKPTVYAYTILNKSTTGFSVIFSGIIDSNNYQLEWITTY